MSFNVVATVYVKGNAYRICFWNMSKDDAISIMNNSSLIDQKGALQFFLAMYKKRMSATPLKKLIIKKTEM